MNAAGGLRVWRPSERGRQAWIEVAVWTLSLAAGMGATVAAGALTDSSAFLLIVVVLAVGIISSTLVVKAHRQHHDAFSPLGLICLYNAATFSVGAVYFYIKPWPGGATAVCPD